MQEHTGCQRCAIGKFSRVTWKRSRNQVHREEALVVLQSRWLDTSFKMHSFDRPTQQNVGFLDNASRCFSHVCLTLTSPHCLLCAVMMDLAHLSSNALPKWACADIVLFFVSFFFRGRQEFFLCLECHVTSANDYICTSRLYLKQFWCLCDVISLRLIIIILCVCIDREMGRQVERWSTSLNFRSLFTTIQKNRTEACTKKISPLWCHKRNALHYWHRLLIFLSPSKKAKGQ